MAEENCYTYSGRVYLVRNNYQLEKAITKLKSQSYLGFDLESRPNFRKNEFHPPAVLQLAASDAVYLFQLQKIEAIKELLAILGDERIVKAGINVAQDIRHLQEVYPDFKPAGFVELATIARELGFEKNGLKTLFLEVFGRKIPTQACLSDWENEYLSRSQIRYAATDAWSALLLYRHFVELKKTPRNSSVTGGGTDFSYR